MMLYCVLNPRNGSYTSLSFESRMKWYSNTGKLNMMKFNLIEQFQKGKAKGGNILKKHFVIMLIVIMILSMVGCSNKKTDSSDETIGDGSSNLEEDGSADSDLGENTGSKDQVSAYESIDLEGMSFTYWMSLDANLNQAISNFSETDFAKNLEAYTGVSIKYQHPAVGSDASEQFNLLYASSSLPDIFEYNILTYYPGGPEKAIEDGVIVDLTPYLEEYAPNLMKYYEEHPEVAKQAKTDTGKYYSFPFVRGDASLLSYFGIIVNSQWLDELGLDYPETMDDWYEMLTLFKNEKGASAPLTYESWMLNNGNGSPFIEAFNVAEDFYIDDDGKVQYGSIEPGYEQFLETFSKWYDEGLIDADIQTMNKSMVGEKMTTGEAGASMGYLASRMGTWLAAVEDKDNFDFTGVKSPVLNEGDIPFLSQKDQAIVGTGDAFISTSCENIEAAVKYLDMAYSEDGNLLYNFGVEGVSYNMIDGYPTYSDLILNNADLSINTALAMHTRANYYGPFVQDKEYYEQYGFTYPKQQQEAISNWTISDVDLHQMPKVTPTPDESEEIAMIMNEITTYRDEMQVKYIIGVESLDSFDTYVQNIKDMGIDRAIEIYQTALERYNNR